MPPLFDQTAPSQQWYQAIAGIVTAAITVVETLQRAGLVFDANNCRTRSTPRRPATPSRVRR